MEFETETDIQISDEQRQLAQTRTVILQPIDPLLTLAPNESVSDDDQHAVLALDNETTIGEPIIDHIGEHTRSAGQQIAVSIATLLGLFTIAGVVIALW